MLTVLNSDLKYNKMKKLKSKIDLIILKKEELSDKS